MCVCVFAYVYMYVCVFTQKEVNGKMALGCVGKARKKEKAMKRSASQYMWALRTSGFVLSQRVQEIAFEMIQGIG